MTLPNEVSGLRVWLKTTEAVSGGYWGILAGEPDPDGLALNDGDQVSTWPDVSGHGNDFTGHAITSKPVFNTNVLNGRAGVRFNGGATIGGFSGPDLSSQITSAATLFIVYKHFGGMGVIFTSDHESGGAHHHDQWWRFSDGAGYWSVLRTSRIASYPSSYPNTGSHYVTLVSSASNYQVWLDGADQGSQSGAFEAPVEPALGYPQSGQWNALPDGWVLEFLLYDNAVSSSDRAGIEAYLAARFNL